MKNLELCENCVYNDPLFKKDCDICKDGDNYFSYEKFNEDMDLYHEQPSDEELKPEETKPRYILIRWLIDLILKYESNHYWIYFQGIVPKPRGKKCEKCDNSLPGWLNWLIREFWVNETSNGGYSGDDWGGAMYYKIFPNFYLMFSYSC